MKKLFKLILSLVLLVGCSVEKPLNAQEILTESNEKMEAVESMSASVFMNIDLQANEQSMKMSMDMDMKYELKEDDLKMSMNLDTEYNGESIVANTVFYDGIMYMDTYGQKVKIEMDSSEVEIDTDMGKIDTTFENMSADKIDGKYVITIQPTKEDLTKLMSNLSSVSENGGLDEETLKAFETIDYKDCILTINSDGYLEKEVISFSAKMQGITMNIDVEMSFSDYNSTVVEEVVNPQNYIDMSDYLS